MGYYVKSDKGNQYFEGPDDVGALAAGMKAAHLDGLTKKQKAAQRAVKAEAKRVMIEVKQLVAMEMFGKLTGAEGRQLFADVGDADTLCSVKSEAEVQAIVDRLITHEDKS